jgi:alpha-tubulin suppressor-like RCC1 family protein
MNDFYQLGVSKPTLKAMKPVSHPSLSNARLRQVAAGSDHSIFLTTEGKVFICGSNEQG